MGKRSRIEDVPKPCNPFWNAKTRKFGQPEGGVQHTIKYYIWELLREQPGGRSVEELLHEMQNRQMRSFASSTKPLSQITTELTRAKEHFTQDPVTRVWTLRAAEVVALSKSPNVEPTVGHGAAEQLPVTKQALPAAAPLPPQPVEEERGPGANPVASQAAARDSPCQESLGEEQQECSSQGAALQGSPKPEARSTSMMDTSPATQAPVRAEQPTGASHSAHEVEMLQQPALPASLQTASDPSPEPSTLLVPATQHVDHGEPALSQPQQHNAEQSKPQVAADVRSSHSVGMQPPEGAQGPVRGSGLQDPDAHPRDPVDANVSPGAAAGQPRFVLSPMSGVLKALDPSPASPMSDLAAQDRSALWQELATSALSGSRVSFCPLRPFAGQQTNEEQQPKADGPAGAFTCSQENQPSQQASDGQVPPLSPSANARAIADGREQIAALGNQAADVEGKLSAGAVLVEDDAAVEAADGAGESLLVPVCLDDAAEDPSMPEDVAVRWVPSPEWTNPYGPPLEPPIPGKDFTPAPLLGTLPQWPFPTLFPPTPERLVPATQRTLDEAQPALLEGPLDEQQPWPPDLLEASFDAPLVPPVQPVQLLEDGEHPLPAVSPAGPLLSGARLPHAGLWGVEPQWGPVPGLLADTLPADVPDCLPSLPASAPPMQLPVAVEACAPVGGVNAPASMGHPMRDPAEELRESIRAAILAQEPKQRSRQPSRQPEVQRRSSERDQRASRHYSSKNEREGRPRDSAERARHDGYREGDRDDKRDRHESRDDSHAERDRQRQHGTDRGRESRRDIHAERERYREHGRDRDHERESQRGGSRKEDTDKERHPKRSRERESEREDRHEGGHRGSTHEDGRHHRRSDDYKGDYRDDFRERERRDSKEERRRDDRSREAHRSSQGHDATRERDRETNRGHSRHVSVRPRSRSRTRDSATPDKDWPFDNGRIIACSKAAVADCMERMTFGSDIRKDLEGIDRRTAVFLWNYENETLHGIFYGSNSKGIKETKSKHDFFLYEVRVREFAHYHSLPLDIVRSIVPGNGATEYGQHLLKTRLDRSCVIKLSRAFARNH